MTDHNSVNGASHDEKGKAFVRAMYRALIMALLLPPFLGGTVMALIGFYPLPEYFGIFTSYAGAYVVLVAVAALLWMRTMIRKIVSADGDNIAAAQRVMAMLGKFPAVLFLMVMLYCGGGIIVANFSIENMGVRYYTLDEHLYSLSGIVPAVLISGLPIYFYVINKMGACYASKDVTRAVAPVWMRLAMLGLVAPMMVDFILLNYLYNHVGYLTFEVVLLWLVLIVFAAGSTYLAWLGMRQGLQPLQSFIASDEVNEYDLQPASLDELGVLTGRLSRLIGRDRAMAARMAEREQQFRSIFEQAAVGIALVAPDGRLLDVNQRYCEITGYQAKELRALNIQAITHEEDIAKDLELQEKLLWNEISTYSLEKRFIQKNGEARWVGLTMSLVRDVQGRPDHFIKVVEDIHQRKLNELELLKLRQRLDVEQSFNNAIVENAGTLIVVLDRGGRIRRFNRACELLTQYTFDEVEGMFVWDYFIPKDEVESVKAVFTALGGIDRHSMHSNCWVSRDGTRHLIEWTNNVLVDKWGEAEYVVAIGMDVTEREEAVSALQRSEETYARAEEITHIGSWDWNILTNDLRWTDEIYRIFGLTPQSFGATYPAFLEAIHPDDRQKVIDAVGEAVGDPKAIYSVEHRVIRPDGSTRIVHERGKVYREDGRPVRMIGTVHDVTEYKEAELEYKTLLQTTSDGFWLVSLQDGEFIEVNEAYCAMVGYSREELMSMRISDIEAMETPEETRRHIEDVISGRNEHFETMHRHKDGRLVYMDVSARFIPVRGGLILVFLRDITERRHADAELANYRDHLEDLVHERTSLLNDAQRIGRIGNWRWDVSSGNLAWSDEIYRIFGHAPGQFEPTYERFMASVHPDDIARIKQSEQEAFDRGERHSVDHRIVMPNGEVRWVHEEALATLGADGKPVALSGTVQDITERKRIEHDLILAKEDAEKASRAKSDFLSRMSHELRTPMNAIIGFTQVLEAEVTDPEQLDFLNEIRNAGDHLLDLINELLDLSRIESGKMISVIQMVALDDVLERSIQMVNTLVKQKDIALINLCSKDFGVLADATRLRQVLVNLLSNAAKYNRDGGSIRLTCKKIDGDRLRINVTDTGPGIAPEKLGRLYTPFDRLGAESSGVDGTGIGLTLSKRLIEMMGGELGVESVLGQGTTFWIALPLARPDSMVTETAEMFAEPGGVAGIKVLYIEDNAANLKVVESMLRHQPGTLLLSANNGEYGLELARRYLPQLILLDIHLPGMDGYEVLKQLQEHAETQGIPVVALSADAMPLDVERGLAAGFRRYLTKPVKMDELIATIGEVAIGTTSVTGTVG